MSSSIQPGFKSLIGEATDKFTRDGTNVITKFLEEYAVKFAKGAAAGKTATTDDMADDATMRRYGG